ncbi:MULTISPECIES: SRPBCC family protein [Nonomuraea]|jgi:uncharacterized protein YndB with AHSA1/START domain|uniref:Uncharacterized protein YndB with AHSA1/START domain n=2 Tax=Nonomuraea TaxID=83681 RepID=A0A7W5YCN2_9ACTN|nr:SRPBCC domain-containing protein [Nonomuraea dietziae]MBB3732606.1 uncharacterized protein YndB with AHSA1/START domain [Nonomuraea dietziae]
MTTAEDLRAIHVDQFLAHPPAKVWRALTEPEHLNKWLMPGDFRPEVGHTFTFQGTPVEAAEFSGTVYCEVLEIEKERLIKLSWDDGSRLGWTVTWRLEPEGRGTRLFLDHEGFDPDDPRQQVSRKIMGGGWRSMHMRAIEKVLAEMG